MYEKTKIRTHMNKLIVCIVYVDIDIISWAALFLDFAFFTELVSNIIKCNIGYAHAHSTPKTQKCKSLAGIKNGHY